MRALLLVFVACACGAEAVSEADVAATRVAVTNGALALLFCSPAQTTAADTPVLVIGAGQRLVVDSDHLYCGFSRTDRPLLVEALP